jgi:hypothetical protein
MSRCAKHFLVAAALLAAWSMLSSGCLLAQDKKPKAKPPAAAPTFADESEDAILKTLEQPTDCDFRATPLREVVAYFSKKHKLHITLDSRALDEAGVKAEAPVTRTLKDVRLRSALGLALDDLELAWIIRDEALVITSKDAAAAFLVTKLYLVPDLVIPTDARGNVIEGVEDDYEWLEEVITTTVAPDSWAEAGGPGTISALRRALVVSQTQANHRRVEYLLAGLRNARRQQDEGKGPERFAVVKYYHGGAAEDRIQSLLQRRSSFAFAGKRLGDVIAELSKAYSLPIQLDRSVKEDMGIDEKNSLVTFRAPEMSLRSALNGILHHLQLSWIINHDMLLITSREKAQAQSSTRIYPVRDLLARDKDGPDYESLIETITSTVAPDSWDEAGGPGTVREFYPSDALVISQSREVHERIEELLAKFRQAMPAMKLTPPEDENAVVWRAYHVVSGTKPEVNLADDVVKLVREYVAPETWKAKEGQAVLRALPDRIVVRQTLRVHAEIAKFLGDLDLLHNQQEPPSPPNEPQSRRHRFGD